MGRDAKKNDTQGDNGGPDTRHIINRRPWSGWIYVSVAPDGGTVNFNRKRTDRWLFPVSNFRMVTRLLAAAM